MEDFDVPDEIVDLIKDHIDVIVSNIDVSDPDVIDCPDASCCVPVVDLVSDSENSGETSDHPEEKEPEREQFDCPVCYQTYLVDDGRICCDGDGIRDVHGICVDCIRRWSAAAVSDTPIAPGGIGLKCVMKNCQNFILMNDFYFYLDPDIHMALIQRMQHEAIVAADLDDLVTCPSCGVKMCVDFNMPFYDCSCGRRQCRNCSRPYDNAHNNKTCAELDLEEAQARVEVAIAPKLSEVVVRTCPRCQLQFVKEDGCNKMTCRCRTTQCYLCRAANVDYDHFCECGPKNIDGVCFQCGKSCPLWANGDDFDAIKIREIRSNADLKSV